jgi:hypothetical protein
MAQKYWDAVATDEFAHMDEAAQRQWADLRKRVSRRPL